MDRGFSPAPLCARGFLHPDAFGQGPEDEGVFVPDQFGKLFLGVTERFDREVGQTEDGRRPFVGPFAKVPDDDEVDVALLVKVAAGKRSVEDDGGDAPARDPGPLRSPGEHFAALQIESAYPMHSPASSPL